jgi:3-hydroxybutyryl-CoA dehydrogenase
LKSNQRGELRVGVVGAGLMGSGISQVSAQCGLSVVMVDISDEALARGRAAINASLDRLLKKEKISPPDKAAALTRITASTDYAVLEGADLVIEAATENVGIKLQILRQVEERVAERTVIASNTSSISITQLAAALKRPERFVGVHFFNPVPMMALVEVIRGLQTGDAAYRTCLDYAQALGKTAITVRNSPGFVVNRILCPMLNEAIFVRQEGLATAEEIDAGMKLGCNHPIGPLALADLVGLDTLLAVLEVFYRDFNDPKYRPAPLLKEMVAAGWLGRKSGRGFFQY